MGDAAIFDQIFRGEGAVPITWEVASRCTTPRAGGGPCFDPATRQPNWECTTCGGLGAVFAAPVHTTALFRGQSRWKSAQSSGEHGLGEAQLTMRVTEKPGYVDDRIRDRITVLVAVGDQAAGRVWYPAAQPVPFIFAGVQRAWRVQLQGLDNTKTRTRPQP